MPAPMVHLLVAKNIIRLGLPVKDMPRFYLGAIAPDAIHMRPGVDRTVKNATHLKPKSGQDIYPNHYSGFMSELIAANKNANEVFLLGYGIHVLTDRYWAQTVYRKFTEDYKNSAAPVEEMAKAYYYDMDIHEYELYHGHVKDSDIWQYLQAPAYADFLDLLTAGEIRLWNERVLNFFDAPENRYKFEGRPKYTGLSDIERFISSCAGLIAGNINVPSFRA